MSNIFKVRRSSPKIKRVKSRVFKEPKQKDLSKMLGRLKRINEQLDEVKPLYKESDEIISAVLRVNEALLRKHGAVIIDNFADKNTQFKVASFKRFDVRWVKP